MRVPNTSRFSTIITIVAISCSFFAVTPATRAANVDVSQCVSLKTAAKGLCTAALKSGCGVDGRHADSRNCSKIASNYRRLTGNDPIWLEPAAPPATPVYLD